MQSSRFFLYIALLLTPIALLGTTWLYLYPFFNSACAFPTPPSSIDANGNLIPGGIAPFRLLALGDPQLEGDTSLPKPGAPIFPSFGNLLSDFRLVVDHADSPSTFGAYKEGWDLVKDRLRDGLIKDLALEGVKWAWKQRKWIDLWGNDWYLAHIVRTLRWWTDPTHVSVLGDLLGSQWVGEEEFARRGNRFWGTVMRGMEKVPESIMSGEEENETDGDGDNQTEKTKKWGGTREVLGADPSWKNRVINIAGNHDIGYAGDIDAARVERFERDFGRVNWDIVFTLPNTSSSSSTFASEPPQLRLVILNSMNLDTPVWTPHLQTETYDFLNHIVATSLPVTSKSHSTILLTHIPLHKPAGTCVDSPLFTYFEGGSGVKEQNMLSEFVSKMVLESVFGLSNSPDAEGQGKGRRGIIVNGHDHAGCDILHWVQQDDAGFDCPAQQPAGEEAMIDPNSDLPVFAANTTSEPSSVEDLASSSTESEPSPEESLDESSEDPPTPYHALPFPPPSLNYAIPSPNHPSSPKCYNPTTSPHLREITLRSMMGDYAGYAGFLSAWYNASSLGEHQADDDGEPQSEGEWVIEFSTCGLGTQHWWWAVHVVDLILVVALVVAGAYLVWEELVARGEKKEGGDRGAKVMGKG